MPITLLNTSILDKDGLRSRCKMNFLVFLENFLKSFRNLRHFSPFPFYISYGISLDHIRNLFVSAVPFSMTCPIPFQFFDETVWVYLCDIISVNFW